MHKCFVNYKVLWRRETSSLATVRQSGETDPVYDRQLNFFIWSFSNDKAQRSGGITQTMENRTGEKSQGG